MPMFTAFSRRRAEMDARTGGGDLPGAVRLQLPHRFEAVAEALWSGGDVVAACEEVGRDVARDGADLGEALSGLRSAYWMVGDHAPPFEAAEALSVAWSEATLSYLHDLSCEDPMTGLTSLAHVRTRLAELYRAAELTDVPVRSSHALVVVELRFRRHDTFADHHFTRALRMAQVAEATRAVYGGGETLARLGRDRAAALVERGPDLGHTVALLGDVLAGEPLGPADTRVWIEGLPASAAAATVLLDELAR